MVLENDQKLSGKAGMDTKTDQNDSNIKRLVKYVPENGCIRIEGNDWFNMFQIMVVLELKGTLENVFKWFINGPFVRLCIWRLSTSAFAYHHKRFFFCNASINYNL